MLNDKEMTNPTCPDCGSTLEHYESGWFVCPNRLGCSYKVKESIWLGLNGWEQAGWNINMKELREVRNGSKTSST